MTKSAARITNAIQRRQQQIAARLNYTLKRDFEHKLIYVSYHKCATQYVQRILADVCRELKLPSIKCDWRGPLTPSELRRHKFIFVQDYSSETFDIAAADGRGFHVIRDPRDILVSTYYSHKDSHVVTDPRAFAALENDPTSAWAEILVNRRYLPTVDRSTGLHHLLETSHYFGRTMHELKQWNFDNPRFYESRFERLTQEPVAEFQAIVDFLQLPLAASRVATIVERNSYAAMKQAWAQRNSEGAAANHYRSGKSGDWTTHFDDALKQRFKALHGELLVKLNYAEDLDW